VCSGVRNAFALRAKVPRINNVQALVIDVFPAQVVASISGLAGTGAGIGAMIFTLGTGWVIDHFGYAPILIFPGLLIPAATIALFELSGNPDDLQATI